MATDASGNIVASGIYGSSTNTYQATFARFTPTGALDTTFGSQGWTTSTLGYDFSNFWCMALQSNGRIVGAGLASYSGVIKILVARYLQ
jgi:hypothetical protein